MSRELSELYRSLAEDADGREPGRSPRSLRRRADRRARRRVAGARARGGAAGRWAWRSAAGWCSPADRRRAAAARPPTRRRRAVPAAPTGGPPRRRHGSTARPPAAVAGTPAVDRAAPAPRRPGRPTAIPDRAFFVLAAANRTGHRNRSVPGPDALPALCDAPLPQRRRRSCSAGAAYLAYKLPETPTGVRPGRQLPAHHHHLPGRAGRRRARASCGRRCGAAPSQELPDDNAVTCRQRLLADGGYGDESVLFEMRAPIRTATATRRAARRSGWSGRSGSATW